MADTTTTVTQTSIPDYAKPYVETMLGQAQALTGQAYQPYTEDRIAQFSPLQQKAFESAGAMQPSAYTGQAAGLASLAGQGALGTYYSPGQYGYLGVNAPNIGGAPQMAGAQSGYMPNLQQYQMGPAQQVSSERVYGPMMQAAQTGYRPDLQQYQMGPAQQVSSERVYGPMMQAAQTGYRPALQQYQMDPRMLERVRSETFLQPGTANAYMSPYMQNVVDIEKREAARQDAIARQGRQAQAVQAGAFGGSRQAIMEAEAQRNLAQQLGDIQTRGTQSAFQQAQAQFNADQSRRMAAEQANQQAMMSAGQQNLAAKLGVQQLGTQTGLQTALANLTNQQQAAVNNQAMQFQAQGMNAQQALQAALANQQAGLTTGQQNLAARLGVQQLGTQTGLQTALANLTNQQQAAVNNQALQFQAQGMNSQQALQAALANQQAGLTTGQQNLAAQLGVQQLGAQTGTQMALANLSNTQQAQVQNLAAQLQTQGLSADQALRAALANQGAYQQAQQLGEQSRQYGAGLGLQGLQTALQGAGVMGGLGQQQFGQQMDITNLQQQYGTQQQQQMQNLMSQQYQDFLNQQKYPYQQIGFMSDLLRGLPMSQSTSTIYAPPPSMANTLGGLGMMAYGSGLFKAKGGSIPSYAKGGTVGAGLADLAISNMA